MARYHGCGSTAADMGVAAIINLFFIYKFIGYRMEIPQLLKTLFAAAVMAVAVYFFYDWTMAWWNIGAISTFGAVFFGCFVYIAVMLLVGGLLEDDLAHADDRPHRHPHPAPHRRIRNLGGISPE